MGNILIWHCPTEERWGAFAGGFEEVDENVEYEEREDEFDIVRPPRSLFRYRSTDHLESQEDEADIARRKMLEEEEDVDIDGGIVDPTENTADHLRQPTENDDDYLWATDEPDDDMKGWKMKVLVEDEQD